MKNQYKIKIMVLLLILLFTNLKIFPKENLEDNILAIKTMDNYLSKESFASKYSLNANSIERFYPLSIRKEGFIEKSITSFEIGNKRFDLQRTKLIKRGSNWHSFIGKTESSNLNNVIISIRNNNVFGKIYLDSLLYRIVTFKDNKFYLIQSNDCCIDNDNDVLSDKYNKSINHSMQSLDESNESSLKTSKIPIININENYFNNLSLNSLNSCEMRIIIMYTPAIDSTVSDILNLIQNQIDDANTILDNSDVNETWELAYAGLTDYDEKSGGDYRSTDLSRFRNKNDGYMDEVHDLREKYSADICVLLSECQAYPGGCGGVAYSVDADTSDAFCLCHTFASHISSFEHEIGHLLACHHQNATSPYSYGHGMVDTTSEWTTIMASGYWEYTEIPYFSNPDKVYEGDTIGTSTYYDCSRVLEQEVPEKVEFFQPESYVTVVSSDVDSMVYGDIISEDSVKIQGVTIPEDSEFKVRSGEILFNNNFSVELGATFEVKIVSINDCP